MNTDKILKSILDPEIGFTSAEKLYRKLNKEIPLKEIKDVMNNLQTYQVNTRKTVKKYNTIVSNNVGDIIQADLMDVSYYTTQNKGVKFLLTFIDVYSRYVLIEPIKTKNMSSATKAMSKLIDKFKIRINNITTDDGPEFHNKQMKTLLDKHNIKHWITPKGTPNKLSIIERFHRTLRNRMNLYFSSNRTNTYLNILDKLVYNYNTTYHSTTKNKPLDIYNNKAFNEQDIEYVEHEYKLNDVVRKVINKGTFGKGSNKYSDTLYKIIEVHSNSYSLANLKTNKKLSRRYLQYELKHAPGPNIDDEYKTDIVNINKKKRLQKRDKAFNDKNTHEVDDYGNVKITRRHLIPKDNKRIRKKREILDL